MTVEIEERLVIYLGNGVTTNFPFDFVIPDADFASVNIQDATSGLVLETLAPGTYTLNGVGDENGGSVDYPIDGSTPLGSTRQLVILRTVPYKQEMSISNQGGFQPEVLEQQLDLIVMQIQQLAEEQSRSLTVSPGQEVPDLTTIAAAEYWALQAAASALEAADYAAFAQHDWVTFDILGNGVQTDWSLTIDPGLANNIFIELDGIFQRPGSSYTLEYVATVPTVRFTEPVPLGVHGLGRLGSSIVVDVNTPSDGSVTTPKIVNNAVTLAKIQDIDTQTFLGRTTAGTGDPEALTLAQTQALVLPIGSVVDSKVVRYSTNAALSGVVPIDDTIPQITEGTELITTTFTMKSVTNILRLRFTGSGTMSAGGSLIASIFIAGDANAKTATYGTVPGANNEILLSCGIDLVPGVLTPLTISVRAGPGSAVNARFNGDTTQRYLGGAAGSILEIQEIKA